jgi:transcriptional regulator with XRE-family HTH domain
MGRRGEHRSEILSSWALPFREARKRLGKTNADIRADTGLANQTINKILKGDDSVLVRHIQRLAAYFGFEVTIAVVEEVKEDG